ncbi:hypothetical protein, partial [Shewanella algae]|uniref:hypothetical protein n=1 Tax=Shewanella algae TaxID=38313 RepID=UPI003005FF65
EQIMESEKGSAYLGNNAQIQRKGAASYWVSQAPLTSLSRLLRDNTFLVVSNRFGTSAAIQDAGQLD